MMRKIFKKCARTHPKQNALVFSDVLHLPIKLHLTYVSDPCDAPMQHLAIVSLNFSQLSECI